MRTVAAVMAELEGLGTEKARAMYAKHGTLTKNVFGVSVANLKQIEKAVRKDAGKAGKAQVQELGLGLYATGNFDACYLAGMLTDGALMAPEQVRAWARGAAGMQMISEYTVPWVAVENVEGRGLALEWIGSDVEHIGASGWCTYSGLAMTKADGELSLAEIESLLQKIVGEIHGAPNRVRHTMNLFLIAAGGFVRPLEKEAKAAAKAIGQVIVDMGDTACKVPSAAESIAKLEAAGKAGVKRKTIRC